MTKGEEKSGKSDRPALVDHLGADLWRASKLYERVMFDRVRTGEFADITLADSDLLPFIDVKGASLSEIARRRGVTRQAVHEAVGSLVKRDYLKTEVDPADKRSKRVTYTDKGLRFIVALDDVKVKLHAELAETIGKRKMAGLVADVKAAAVALAEMEKVEIE